MATLKEKAVSAATIREYYLLKTLTELSLPIMGTVIAQAATVISNQARGAFVVLATMQGAFMMGLKEGSFNVATAFAARLGDVDVTVHAAIIIVISFTFYGFPS
ncbi:hypothetical protein JKP88DRAFT_273734 [Tribonema minus]|uniref:Uncharacterized protein n=1 Tax=Tribonema minus TaxID=303371 RepID=A0A835YRP4_9STRA|nr:hypothetical protein JKP88DRAFT_273734 [Tribonema minus]